MLKTDLFKVSSKIIIEGTKAVTFGAGLTLARQVIVNSSNTDTKTIKDLIKTLDTSLDTLLK